MGVNVVVLEIVVDLASEFGLGRVVALALVFLFVVLIVPAAIEATPQLGLRVVTCLWLHSALTADRNGMKRNRQEPSVAYGKTTIPNSPLEVAAI
jgi:hypothetical protein